MKLGIESRITFPNLETARQWYELTKIPITVDRAPSGVLLWQSVETFSRGKWLDLQRMAMDISSSLSSRRVSIP